MSAPLAVGPAQLGIAVGAGGKLPFVPTDDDARRLARYAEALAFFQGSQWEGKRRRGETRLTLNYARALTRKAASYVFPAPVSFTVPPPTGGKRHQAAASAAEAALADLCAGLDLGALDLALCVDQGVLGDCAVKVTWDGDAKRPNVAAVDPATLFAWWAPDDPRRAYRVAQVYQLPGHAIAETFAAAAGLALTPAGWYPVVEEWTAARWAVWVGETALFAVANPYGWVPYVVAANNARPDRFWGESDLVDLYGVCRELNARASTLSRVLELSGAPITVLENVDGSEGIQVGPGAKWEIPEGAKAYLLDLLAGGGVALHIQDIELVYRALHDLAETPRTAFGDNGRAVSGAALEVEVQPLVQKVRRKRRGFEALYRARNERLLDLLERFGGMSFGGLRRTETVWPEILPSDEDAHVRNQVALVNARISSRRTAAAALGTEDPEAELAAILEEAAKLSAVTSPQPSAVSRQPVGDGGAAGGG